MFSGRIAIDSPARNFGGKMAILSVAAAILLCAVMANVLRPVTTSQQNIQLVGFDGAGLILVFVIYVAAAAFLGDTFAISLIAAFLLHEGGHVLANRMLNRGTSRFRMVPLLAGQQVCETPFRSEGAAFFVALMGAGFSLAPMSLAFALALLLRSTGPELADFLIVFGATIGAVNFLALLPFRPLDGGRCAAIAARNFWPALAPSYTIFMIAAFMTAGVKNGSVALLALAAFGLQSLIRKPGRPLVPMGASTGLIGLAAYTFTLAAHFTAGWLLFDLVV